MRYELHMSLAVSYESVHHMLGGLRKSIPAWKQYPENRAAAYCFMLISLGHFCSHVCVCVLVLSWTCVHENGEAHGQEGKGRERREEELSDFMVRGQISKRLRLIEVSFAGILSLLLPYVQLKRLR